MAVGAIRDSSESQKGGSMKKSEVLKRIGEDRWNEFQKFMTGQTIGWTNGEADYYEQDVENFMRKPNRRFFD